MCMFYGTLSVHEPGSNDTQSNKFSLGRMHLYLYTIFYYVLKDILQIIIQWELNFQPLCY